MLIAYAVWLAHKAADVMSEVQVLADRTGQLSTCSVRSRFRTRGSIRRTDTATSQLSQGVDQLIGNVG